MSHDHPSSEDQNVNRKQYEAGYLRIFGLVCPRCGGHPRGVPAADGGWVTCPVCYGVGFIERSKDHGRTEKGGAVQ